MIRRFDDAACCAGQNTYLRMLIHQDAASRSTRAYASNAHAEPISRECTCAKKRKPSRCGSRFVREASCCCTGGATSIAGLTSCLPALALASMSRWRRSADSDLRCRGARRASF